MITSLLPVPHDAIALGDGGAVPHGHCFQWNGMKIIRSLDGGKLHISLSRPDGIPSYQDIKDVRYAFGPDNITMVQIFPPSKDFVNVHPHVLHLYQL